MKQYTKIRQAYAWLGFLTTVIFVVFSIGMAIYGLLTLYKVDNSLEVKEVLEVNFEPKEVIIVITKIVEVSAYTSDVTETDSTPFITASNQRVRDGIIANNCLEFGSIVEIEGKEYEVQDRMNKRYGCDYFDIWMSKKVDALEWGRRELAIIIN